MSGMVLTIWVNVPDFPKLMNGEEVEFYSHSVIKTVKIEIAIDQYDVNFRDATDYRNPDYPRYFVSFSKKK